MNSTWSTYDMSPYGNGQKMQLDPMAVKIMNPICFHKVNKCFTERDMYLTDPIVGSLRNTKFK